MYTPDELAAIREQERRIDMEYDASGRERLMAYRRARATTHQRLDDELAASNPALAARLAAIRERLAAEAEDKRDA